MMRWQQIARHVLVGTQCRGWCITQAIDSLSVRSAEVETEKKQPRINRTSVVTSSCHHFNAAKKIIYFPVISCREICRRRALRSAPHKFKQNNEWFHFSRDPFPLPRHFSEDLFEGKKCNVSVTSPDLFGWKCIRKGELTDAFVMLWIS